MKKFLKNILIEYRGLIIFLFAVPISFIFQKIQNIQNWVYRHFFNTDRLHDRKVNEIINHVKKAKKEGKKMCTARAPWKTMSIRKATYKNELAQIPVNLKNILLLDEENKVIRVEPMVTMGEITQYLVPRGYALAVQVEMDDLTIGGLCMGLGIETSSHRYGFLFETVEAYELITAEGVLIRATGTENPDLFHILPMSHGTLGFLVAVELKIVPVRKYMKLRYIPFHNRKNFCEKLKNLTRAEALPEFLEGLVFSSDSGVIIEGNFTDKPLSDGKINPINRWFKPWFYDHVNSFLGKGETIEYIPLRHYYHRHTPSVFFQLRDLIPFANRIWYRYLFAWMGAPKISLMKFSMTRELRRQAFENRVAQDIIIPIEDLDEAIQFVDESYAIYPLWICPVRLFSHEPMEGIISNPTCDDDGFKSKMYVDLGIYGISPHVKSGRWDSVSISRKLEAFTRSKKGFHMLYADIFMTRNEFEQMFKHTLYRIVRQKYSAEGSFPEIYDKIIPEKWLFDIEQMMKKQSFENEFIEK